MQLGEYISKKRKEKKLSRQKLSNIAGLSEVYLRQIENGERKLYDVTKIENIGKALGLKVTEIEMMMNMSGEAKGTVAPDLKQYCADNPQINYILRTLMKNNIKEEQLKKYSL